MRPRAFEVVKDYPDICEWWRAHRFRYVPLDALPRVGVVVEDDQHKYCAGFLYTAEAGWGWLEWVVTNPESPYRQRPEALKVLVKSLTEIARSAGISRMISSLHSKGLIEIFEQNGFRRGDAGAQEMLWGGWS